MDKKVEGNRKVSAKDFVRAFFPNAKTYKGINNGMPAWKQPIFCISEPNIMSAIQLGECKLTRAQAWSEGKRFIVDFYEKHTDPEVKEEYNNILIDLYAPQTKTIINPTPEK